MTFIVKLQSTRYVKHLFLTKSPKELPKNGKKMYLFNTNIYLFLKDLYC